MVLTLLNSANLQATKEWLHRMGVGKLRQLPRLSGSKVFPPRYSRSRTGLLGATVASEANTLGR